MSIWLLRKEKKIKQSRRVYFLGLQPRKQKKSREVFDTTTFVASVSGNETIENISVTRFFFSLKLKKKRTKRKEKKLIMNERIYTLMICKLFSIVIHLIAENKNNF